MRYWGALDGLRGVALLAVVLFHAKVPQFQGGFLGVDVFFVLSGFLITAHLLSELQKSGTISLKQFYIRRAVRLLPALSLLLATYTVAWAFGLIRSDSKNVVIDLVLALFALTNWFRAFEWHDPAYLGHAWSLGVEEQFYLVWPILILLMGKNALKPRKVALVAGIATVVGAFWMQWLQADGASSNRLYNGLDTRAMSLLCGCALAGWVHSTNLLLLEPLRDCSINLWTSLGSCFIGWLGLAGLLGLMVYADWRHPLMFSWGYIVVALLAMSVIASVVYCPKGALATALAWPPLVVVGKLSYGLYLWHYPLFSIATEQSKSRGYPLEVSLLIGWILTLVAAWASYHWLERPFRTRILGAKLV